MHGRKYRFLAFYSTTNTPPIHNSGPSKTSVSALGQKERNVHWPRHGTRHPLHEARVYGLSARRHTGQNTTTTTHKEC